MDYIAAISCHYRIHYLWRPLLRDAKDDMVLELAATAGCDAIITYNRRDFRGSERFGVRVMTPRELLEEMGELR